VSGDLAFDWSLQEYILLSFVSEDIADRILSRLLLLLVQSDTSERILIDKLIDVADVYSVFP
jgi:hypothetical protein